MERTRRMFLGLSVDNMLVVLTMLGAIGSGIYEAGELKATLAASVQQERSIREAEISAVTSQIGDLKKTAEETHNDIRELRSYLMVNAQFGSRTR
jgi:replication-associated recombination protein RarA